jgi:hypothetical protein
MYCSGLQKGRKQEDSMNNGRRQKILYGLAWAVAVALISAPALAQLIDKTKAPNAANEGIKKTLAQEIGAGRGDVMTPDSSAFNISRDPFRAVRRGRQLFQRKFTRAEGQGPNVGDGAGDINTNLAIGAGLSDSCALCHGRPRGSAGSAGNVVTRPDSRDAPHLFGLGLKEMLADEITSDLRAIRAQALLLAHNTGQPITRRLVSKGISYGSITARADGTVDTSNVQGMDPDLRVKPFFAHGGAFSIRQFVVGALKNEMGLEAVDPDLRVVSQGGKVTTPSGLVLDGSLDPVDPPPAADANSDGDHDGITNEVPQSLVDYLEFYLLNYFKPAVYRETAVTHHGQAVFAGVGCARCHIANLPIVRDRRVADVTTSYDPLRGIFNNLFATPVTMVNTIQDAGSFPPLKVPQLRPFMVTDFYSDLKRHDLGPNFHERNYDGTLQTQFMTTPLWGVGSTAPYGHDGRSVNLIEVIVRHGGEAQTSRDNFVRLNDEDQTALIAFLNSLVLFPPDDTASSLDPGNRNTPGFPQFGHGSIKLSVLFNNPADPE